MSKSYAAGWLLDAWSSRANQRAHRFPSFNVTDEEFHVSACGKARAAAFIPAQPGTHAYCKVCARHEPPTLPASTSPDASAALADNGDGGDAKACEL